MAKMAVIGDSTSILGFQPIGVETYSVDDPADVGEVWPDLLAGDYAIIFMTEPVFEAAAPLLKDIETRSTPAVVAIPYTGGSIGAGRRYIAALVERAVGATLKTKGE